MKTDGIARFFDGVIAWPSLLLMTILTRGAVCINQSAIRLEKRFLGESLWRDPTAEGTGHGRLAGGGCLQW